SPVLLGDVDTLRWPPDAPPLADLIRAYRNLIRRTARTSGVRKADLDDCVQIVHFRLHQAVSTKRVDPRGKLGGWLLVTTWSVARDFRKRGYAKHEVLTAADAPEDAADAYAVADRIAEAVDVHDAVALVLRRLKPAQRKVFVMHLLEDVPMEDVIAMLD